MKKHRGALFSGLSQLLLILSVLLVAGCEAPILASTPPSEMMKAARGEWAANVSYAVGDTVTYQGTTYTCRQTHTSIVGWEPPNVPALWLAGGSVTTTPLPTPTPTPTPSTSSTPTPTPVTTATPTPNSGAFTAADFLKANGTTIRKNSGSGNVVDLRGTNLGGWMVQESWMTPLSVTDEWTLRETLTSRFGEATKDSLIHGYQNTWITSADFDRIKAMGMNMVRVPVLYLEFMDKFGNWKSDPWTQLDWLVGQAAARGIYVIIDLHGTFGAQNKWDNSGQANSDPQLWKNSTYQDRTVALWQGIAAHYKGNPAIAAYDLLNEPDVVTQAQLNAFYNRLYQAIRAVDPDHMINLECFWNWNQLVAPSVYGWTNVQYQIHHYAMATGESTNWSVQNNLVNNAMADLLARQSQWNVPVHVGEFCLFDFTDLWANFLGRMNAAHVSWSNWTYKVASNYGNWGYYNSNPNPAPDVNSESAASIAQKWSMFNTERFNTNTTLINVVKQYTTGTTSPPGQYSYLRAMANNNIVCADNAGANPLVANRTSAGDWELFTVINNSDGTVSFQSKANGLYVCADLNQAAKVIARSTSIQGWEKFKKVDQGNGTFALQAMANNLYVTTDLNNGAVLYATRAAVGGAWEAFTLTSQ